VAGPLDNFVQQVKQQRGFFNPTVGRGSLIWFKYPVSLSKDRYQIHDPTPLVIVTDIWPNILRGVNLHYLTLPYINNLMTQCDNPNYSYGNVRGDRYIANAFRMYYRRGMSGIQKVDCSTLFSMQEVDRQRKLLTPAELEAMRKQMQAQIQSVLQNQTTDLNQMEQQKLSNWQNQPAPTPQPGQQPTNTPPNTPEV
jgi:hypothetical protein